MDAIPTKEELYARFLNESNGGKGFSDEEKKIINQPYCTGQDIFPPRYYQRNAVNRTVNAVAQGKNRLLLVMATGTGKTYTAFQIVYRLLKAGLVKKVLYLADRNVLVDQSIQQDFKPLSSTIHKVDYQKDIETNGGHLAYEVYFSLYQQLIGKEGNCLSRGSLIWLSLTSAIVEVPKMIATGVKFWNTLMVQFNWV